jgi:hypothetical protein
MARLKELDGQLSIMTIAAARKNPDPRWRCFDPIMSTPKKYRCTSSAIPSSSREEGVRR